MSSRSRNFTASFVVTFVLALAALCGTAKAAPALVVNHGNGVNAPCKADVTMSDGSYLVYFGYIDHFVLTSSGHISLGCQLVGPALGYTLRLSDLIIQPNGHAVLTENDA